MAASYDRILAFSLGGIDGVQLVMFALALAGLTVLMISTRNKLRDRAAAPRISASERMAKRREESGARDDLRAVMLELDEVSRQAHARLDTKFAKLEMVIRDADQRIATLERLLRDQRGDASCDVVLPAEHPLGTSSEHVPPEATVAHKQVYELADSGVAAPRIALQLDQPVGEIELILALRAAQQSATDAAGLTPAPHSATRG